MFISLDVSQPFLTSNPQLRGLHINANDDFGVDSLIDLIWNNQRLQILNVKSFEVSRVTRTQIDELKEERQELTRLFVKSYKFFFGDIIYVLTNFGLQLFSCWVDPLVKNLVRANIPRIGWRDKSNADDRFVDLARVRPKKVKDVEFEKKMRQGKLVFDKKENLLKD